MTRRYYIGREECWGGTYVWFVRDSERSWPYRASIVGKCYQTERGAKMACDRANADFERFTSRAELTQADYEAEFARQRRICEKDPDCVQRSNLRCRCLELEGAIMAMKARPRNAVQ